MLALVALGATGICVELLSLEHYADANQMIPLAVAGWGLFSIAWVGTLPGVVAVRTFQFTMLLFVGTGITGITMHADSIDPNVNPPLLAPGLFVQLGLLGLLYSLKHPATEPPPAGYR